MSKSSMSPPSPYRLSARTLAIAALLLWVGSLFLNGLTTGRNEWSGFALVLEGWLGVFGPYFAWLANPFLLWAGRSILKGRTASLPAVLAVLLACDTVRVHQILVDEAGHTAPVYAYGWGAILWGLSMTLMLAAAGTRLLELGTTGGTGPSGKFPDSVWLRPLGLWLSAAGAVSAVAIHLHQWHIGNADERAALHRSAFKIVPLCRASEPAVIESLAAAGGAVEVRLGGDAQHSPPWNSPETLLAWGMPSVRYGDRDYTLIESAEASFMTSTRATARAAAVLSVDSATIDGRAAVHATLIEVSSGHTVFSQTWSQLTPAGQMCPRYEVQSAPEEQPHKLLRQALRLPDKTTPMLDFDRYWAIMGKVLPVQVVSRGTGDTKSRMTTNCPANVGWTQRETDPLQVSFDPFQVDQTVYYNLTASDENVRCEDHVVYFYRAWNLEKQHQGAVRIEARSLPDFKNLWAGMLPLDEVSSNTPSKGIVMRSAESTSDGLKIDFLNLQTGRSVVVSLPGISREVACDSQPCTAP